MSVMEILHTAYVIKAKIDFENADFGDFSKRNSYAEKTPTTTLPFLETEYGNISESVSIETFLARNYQPELLGGNLFEKAKVRFFSLSHKPSSIFPPHFLPTNSGRCTIYVQ